MVNGNLPSAAHSRGRAMTTDTPTSTVALAATLRCWSARACRAMPQPVCASALTTSSFTSSQSRRSARCGARCCGPSGFTRRLKGP